MYFRYEFFGSTEIFTSNKEMEMKCSEKQWLGYIRARAGFNMGTEACPGSSPPCTANVITNQVWLTDQRAKFLGN